MTDCAAYDVEGAAHPVTPVDIAGYDPVIPHQTGCMISSIDCHPDTQCAYDDRDGDVASGGVEVPADTLSTAVSAEAVASRAIMDIAAPADGVDGAELKGVGYEIDILALH